MTPGLVARAYRWFSLLPHFKGKSRLEAIVEPFIPLPRGRPLLTFATGFQMALRSDSAYERSIYFHNCEKDTYELLQRLLHPGDRFVDCGANLGFYTLLAATLVGPSGHVDAFEPTPETFARLEENVRCNHLAQVSLHQMALGDAQAHADVYGLSRDNHGMNFVGQSSAGAARVGTCVIETLDGLHERGLLGRPTVLKIDVEGGELSLLKGARELLRSQNPPAVIIELSRLTTARFGYCPEDLVEYMHSLGDFVLEYPARGKIRRVPRGAVLPHYAEVGRDAGANYLFRAEGHAA